MSVIGHQLVTTPSPTHASL